MFLGFTNTKISNKHKLLSVSKLPPLFSQPLHFFGKVYPPPFFREKTELEAIKPLIKGNVKYTKSLNFLLIFIISFYFEELY